MKECKTCKHVKQVNDFGKNKRSKDGLNVHCRDCFLPIQRERHARWKEKDPERAAEVIKNACDTYRSKPESKEKIKTQKARKSEEMRRKNKRLEDPEYAKANPDELKQRLYEKYLANERSRIYREKKRAEKEAQKQLEALTPVTEKTCSKCGAIKPLDSYGKNTNRCKQCAAKYKKEWRENNINRIKKNRKDKYWDDPELARMKSLDWYYDNMEAAKDVRRNYHWKNRDDILTKKREYYNKNRDSILEDQHLRYLYDDEFRKQTNIRAAKWSKENRDRQSKYAKEYYKHPERRRKNKTRSLTRLAIMRGDLKVQTSCAFCESKEHLEVHHLNYDDPLDVIWLCRKCHRKAHSVETLINRTKTKP